MLSQLRVPLNIAMASALVGCQSNRDACPSATELIAWAAPPQQSFSAALGLLGEVNDPKAWAANFCLADESLPVELRAGSGIFLTGWRFKPCQIQRLRESQDGPGDDFVQASVGSVELVLLDARDERHRVSSVTINVERAPVDILLVLHVADPSIEIPRNGIAEIFQLEANGLRLLSRNVIPSDVLDGDHSDAPQRWLTKTSHFSVDEGREVALCFWSWHRPHNAFDVPALRWFKDHGGAIAEFPLAPNAPDLIEIPLSDWPSPVIGLIARPLFGLRR